jgi:hypothetical protein
MEDFIKLKGVVELVLTDGHGNVKETRKANLVVNAGRNWLWNMACSASPPAKMGYMALGTGATPAALGDTTLGNELAGSRIATSTPGTVGTTASVWTAVFNPGIGTGALTEAGIFNAAATNTGAMLAHVVFGTLTKNVPDTLTITWTITLD